MGDEYIDIQCESGSIQIRNIQKCQKKDRKRFFGAESDFETSFLIKINYFQSKMRIKSIHFCTKTVNNIQKILLLNMISTVLLIL